MEQHFFISNIDIISRLLVAMILGVLLGIERAVAGKTAGVRTYALVSIGAALFVIVSVIVSGWYLGEMSFDPLRVASQIVVGIGFLGAGLIVFKESHLSGLTTAAGLWVAAGIGMASGFGLFLLAIVATLITLFVFTVMWFVEERYIEQGKFKKLYDGSTEHQKHSDN
ncbi:MAG: hypothetical protein UW53_C0034G0007 [Candidatus Giovannonibacteria bacterium GW2011_GWA1_44_25]|uniref:MgtC/SapB/SrpB/YhiD N-terminal domain-containing protein n=1 Tax=Candidatus Giovannonibacteria bacterium GW2011_GWA1_44_25 TaxID=1618645 RepID=A0A0G1IGX6_9BACT|nr:MAG: hypothetical protein UW53_C0034G0007 [Candidatus Giovannonibacteria bacterium GW2011_GWA1_44_25]